jgi:uncharacterized protein (TIGR04255 family)
LNEAGTELVQVQQDRFARNWRKAGDGDTYPRYEYIREQFQRDFGLFQDFLRKNDLGTCVPVQCEVTYVNHIQRGAVWESHGEVNRVIQPWSGQTSDDFLPPPDDVAIVAKYIIPDQLDEPAGRLTVEVIPAYRSPDDVHMLVMNMVARGRPLGAGTDGVMRFLDTGRDWIVRGFASITTKAMQKAWERRDDR